MWMANHQLPLSQCRKLGSRRRAQHRVTRCRELVGIHPPEQRGPGVTDDAAVNLRPELLGAEENQAQIAPSLRDIEQHFPDVSIWPIARRVLVELVDEHHEVFDAEVSSLQVLAQLGDDAGKDEILRIFLEVCDVHYVHRLVAKAPERKVADGPGIGHQSSASGRDV